MSAIRRFYSEAPIAGETVVLTEDEARHALQVVRLRVGEEATLFDGSGVEFRARLEAEDPRSATFRVLERFEVSRTPRLAVTVASAVPKGKRAEFLVEKLCELGAARFIPLAFERSVVDPRVRPENHLRKWRRTVVEAAKQCGRNRLMDVAAALSFPDLCETAGSYGSAWVCDASGKAPPPEIAREGETALAVVGPEGGLTEGESATAKERGIAPLSLGATILRVETAGVAALVRLLTASEIETA